LYWPAGLLTSAKKMQEKINYPGEFFPFFPMNKKKIVVVKKLKKKILIPFSMYPL